MLCDDGDLARFLSRDASACTSFRVSIDTDAARLERFYISAFLLVYLNETTQI